MITRFIFRFPSCFSHENTCVSKTMWLSYNRQLHCVLSIQTMTIIFNNAKIHVRAMISEKNKEIASGLLQQIYYNLQLGGGGHRTSQYNIFKCACSWYWWFNHLHFLCPMNIILFDNNLPSIWLTSIFGILKFVQLLKILWSVLDLPIKLNWDISFFADLWQIIWIGKGWLSLDIGEFRELYIYAHSCRTVEKNDLVHAKWWDGSSTVLLLLKRGTA